MLARLEVVVVFESGLSDFVELVSLNYQLMKQYFKKRRNIIDVSLVSVNYNNSFLELPQDLQRVFILDTVVKLRLVVTGLRESDSRLLLQLS